MFNFSSGERRSLTMGNPPIVRAVVQVVFPPALRLATAEGASQLQDAFGGAFQVQSTLPDAGLRIPCGSPASGQDGVRFVHRDGYELSITTENVTLMIDQRYRDRAHFQTELERVLSAVGKAGRVDKYLRVGVRYINAAPATLADFRAWFKPEFTGWAAGTLLAPDCQRTWVLITQVNYPEADSKITNGAIRYGYVPAGVGVDITTSAAASTPSFLADIDLGSQRPGTFDPQGLGELFHTINGEIAAFFEYTLSEAGFSHFALATKA
jgi:uncharacterized protein (TIGR04255 family)